MATTLKDAVKKKLFGGKIKFRSELEAEEVKETGTEEVAAEPVEEQKSDELLS